MIESFLAIDVVLFLPAVGFKCIRRGCLLAAAGLFCFAAECYLSFSPHVINSIYEHFERSFLVTFKNILIILLGTLSTLATFAIGLIVLYFVKPLPRPEIEATDEVGELARRLAKQEFVDSHTIRLLTSMTMLYLPLCLIATAWPLSSTIFTELPPQLTLSLRVTCSRFARGLVPKSNICQRTRPGHSSSGGGHCDWLQPIQRCQQLPRSLASTHERKAAAARA